MADINGQTGRYFTESETDAAIVQALRDRILTARGTRLMRRRYGTALPDRIGQYITEFEIERILVLAAADERPRLTLDSIEAWYDSPTEMTVYLRGRYRNPRRTVRDRDRGRSVNAEMTIGVGT